jgi:hypothetical protein
MLKSSPFTLLLQSVPWTTVEWKVGEFDGPFEDKLGMYTFNTPSKPGSWKDAVVTLVSRCRCLLVKMAKQKKAFGPRAAGDVWAAQGTTTESDDCLDPALRNERYAQHCAQRLSKKIAPQGPDAGLQKKGGRKTAKVPPPNKVSETVFFFLLASHT